MSINFGPVERVFVTEVGALVPPSIVLPPGGAINLAAITVLGDCPAILLKAEVNWSVTFTPIEFPFFVTDSGFAQVTFEILLNEAPIYRVTESAAQQGVSVANIFDTASTSFVTTSLLHFDLSNITGMSTTIVDTYTLRASNIILSPPNFFGFPVGTVTAAAGPVTFEAEFVRVLRD